MRDKEIAENNKLIAEFMELDNSDAFSNKAMTFANFHVKYLHLFNDEWYDYKTIKFNESWDLLFPVVEKIEKEYCSTNIHYYSGGHFKQQTVVSFAGYTVNCHIIAINKNKIDAVYEAVVKFIKAYNNNFK